VLAKSQFERFEPLNSLNYRATESMSFSLYLLILPDISEVAKYSSPPSAVKLVLEGLCIMFQIAPMKIGEAGRKTDDYW
jgi:hypothetical protein